MGSYRANMTYLAQTFRKSPQTYSSVTITGFLPCTVYFSVTLKKNIGKLSQTNYFYVQIRPSMKFGRHLFFPLSLSLDNSINAIWLASACAGNFAWMRFDWLTHTLPLERFELFSTFNASNATEPKFSLAMHDVIPFKVNWDASLLKHPTNRLNVQ